MSPSIFVAMLFFGVVIGHPFVAISFVTEVVVARGVAINIRSFVVDFVGYVVVAINDVCWCWCRFCGR